MIPILSMDQAKRWAVWLTRLDDVNHRKRGVSLMRHVLEDPPA